MWNPYLIAALISQAGSMYANSRAQSSVNDERRRIDKQAKEVRDRAYQGAESARQQNLTGVSETGTDLAKASAARTEKYIAAEAPSTANPGLMSPDARGDSAVVKEDERQKAKAKSFTGQMAGARGELDGLSDVFMQSGLRTAETGRDIYQNADTARGWMQNVVPYQLQHADTFGDSAANIGQILQMLAMAAAAKSGDWKQNAATPGQTTVPFFGKDMPATIGDLRTQSLQQPGKTAFDDWQASQWPARPGMTPDNLWNLPNVWKPPRGGI